jgi:hypothetical protein
LNKIFRRSSYPQATPQIPENMKSPKLIMKIKDKLYTNDIKYWLIKSEKNKPQIPADECRFIASKFVHG